MVIRREIHVEQEEVNDILNVLDLIDEVSISTFDCKKDFLKVVFLKTIEGVTVIVEVGKVVVVLELPTDLVSVLHSGLVSVDY